MILLDLDYSPGEAIQFIRLTTDRVNLGQYIDDGSFVEYLKSSQGKEILPDDIRWAYLVETMPQATKIWLTFSRFL